MAEADSSTVKLKKGDYSVHLFLEEGRGLLGAEEGDAIDPIVCVTVNKKEKNTKAQKDITSGSAVVWGDHFYF